MNFTD